MGKISSNVDVSTGETVFTETSDQPMTDTSGAPVKDDKGNTVMQSRTWRTRNLEQGAKLVPTFQGVSAGEASAMADKINEARKQRDS